MPSPQIHRSRYWGHDKWHADGICLSLRHFALASALFMPFELDVTTLIKPARAIAWFKCSMTCSMRLSPAMQMSLQHFLPENVEWATVILVFKSGQQHHVIAEFSSHYYIKRLTAPSASRLGPEATRSTGPYRWRAIRGGVKRDFIGGLYSISSRRLLYGLFSQREISGLSRRRDDYLSGFGAIDFAYPASIIGLAISMAVWWYRLLNWYFTPSLIDTFIVALE